MVSWLVTGAGGALGSDLLELLRDSGADVVGLTHRDLDIADDAAITDALAARRPDVIVNAAAYTRVDDAETDEQQAMRVNGEAPGNLARWCAANGARLVHVSTDYVFAGDASTPYDVDAPTAPRSAYGRTKLAGEHAVSAAGGDAHVVRTAWVYGERGTNFIRTIGRRLRDGQGVEVVDDQRGAPTWSRDLARGLIRLAEADLPSGTWHCSAQGEATWYDVAVALAEELGCDAELVRPTTSAAFARPAPRPPYSVLSNRTWIGAGLPALPHWRDELREALRSVGEDLTK